MKTMGYGDGSAGNGTFLISMGPSSFLRTPMNLDVVELVHNAHDSERGGGNWQIPENVQKS